LLAGEIDRQQAIALTLQRTRQLAKRQRTWFRRQHRPHWLHGADLAAQARQLAQQGLG
jgi:tRNA dimethylallyltransferase